MQHVVDEDRVDRFRRQTRHQTDVTVRVWSPRVLRRGFNAHEVECATPTPAVPSQLLQQGTVAAAEIKDTCSTSDTNHRIEFDVRPVEVCNGTHDRLVNPVLAQSFGEPIDRAVRAQEERDIDIGSVVVVGGG